MAKRRYFTVAREKLEFRKQRKAAQPPREYVDREVDKPTHCIICERPSADMVADHCHQTGRSRDWICRTCNVGLGMFKDQPDVLERAAAYLRRHQTRPPLNLLLEYQRTHPKAHKM